MSEVATGALPTQRELEAEYRRYVHAFEDGDTNTILEMLTPDFLWQLPNGQTFDLTQTEAALRELFTAPGAPGRMEIEIMEVETEPPTRAMTLIRERIITPQTGNTPDTVTIEDIREHWVRTSDGWRIRHSEVLRSVTE